MNTRHFLNFFFSVNDVTSVLVDYGKGKELVDLLHKFDNVNVTITLFGPRETKTGTNQGQLNNTSVLFVSISFIVLIIISLAWLVFYYIQRCRYTNAKERLSVSICNFKLKKLVFDMMKN